MSTKGVYVSLLLAILLASCRSTPIQPVPTVATAQLSVFTATKIPQTRTVETPPATATLPPAFPQSFATLTTTPPPTSHPIQTVTFAASRTLSNGNEEWRSSYWLSISDASFINPEQGWALFNNNLLFQTMDGGASWIELPGLNQVIRKIQFVSLTRGWAYTDDGLYTTQDGGHHWERVLETNSLGQSIQFINETLGYMIRGTGSNRTTDGGKTWSPINSEAFADLTGESWGLASFSFINDRKGWALFQDCNSPFCRMKLFITGDGGNTFTLITESGLDFKNSTLNWLRPGSEIFFLDDQHGWFVGNQYFFQYTEDGGKTWKSQRLPQGFYSINSIHMFTTSEGIATGWGDSATYRGVIKTHDGGKTWEPLLPSVHPDFTIQLVDPMHGFGLGGFLDLLAVTATEDGGKNWKKIGELPRYSRKIQFIDQDVAYAGVGDYLEGNQDYLWVTGNGGKTWASILLPTGFRLQNFFFSSPEAGTAWDTQKNTIQTNDGGKTWQPIYSDQIKLLLPNSDSSWLVTATDLYHMLPASKGWNPVLSMDAISRFMPFSETTAVVFGQKEVKSTSTLFRTIDGGKTWQPVKTLPAGILDLDFIDLDHGWAIYGSFLLKTDDGGFTWQQIPP